MKNLLFLLLVTSPTFASDKAIYGSDSRMEVVESKNPLHQTLASSVAAMVAKDSIKSAGNGLSSLDPTSLKKRLGVCSSERFAKQQSASDCTGFLIAPNLLATAGHCIADDMCKDNKWVFDYKLAKATDTQVGTVKNSNIYSCKRVVDYEFGFFSVVDWAVIELDRPVTGRTPLKLSHTSPKKSDGVFVIGTPSGVPLKVATGIVNKHSDADYFSTNLDTFGGNSGSPVFNSKTGLVEGILVRGDVDYRRTWLGLGCAKSEIYSEKGGSEHVTRIKFVKDILK